MQYYGMKFTFSVRKINAVLLSGRRKEISWEKIVSHKL